MKNPPHRAWLVCLGGALAMFAVMGLGVNVFSIYQPEIIRLNGFTDAQGSWITLSYMVKNRHPQRMPEAKSFQ